MAAYSAVRTWVRAAQTPDEAPEGLPECAGASVVLMLDGRVIGRSSRMGKGDEIAGEPIWRAARQALAQANAAREDLVDRADSIRISLELSGALVPMTDDELRAPALTLSPGLDGVAVRRADQLEGVFPGQILRRNTDAGRAIVGLVGEIAGDARAGLEPVEALKERGYVFYRFRSSHIAQPAPGAGAVFLQRGGREFQRSELNYGELNRFADALAGRLIGSMWPGVEPLGVLGAYDPVLDRQIDKLASPVEQAFVALALTKYASTQPVGARRAAALSSARQILEDLAEVGQGETDPSGDLGACAASIIALAAYHRADPDALGSNERLQRLLKLWMNVKQTRADGVFREGIPPSAYGLLAHAAVGARSLGVEFNDDPPESWVVDVYRRTPPELLAGQMPWLGWASVEIAGPDPVASAEALRLMRELVWEHQLQITDLDPMEADLAGGVVFTKGANPLPTWNLARPLAFIATMLAEPSLTQGSLEAGEVPEEMARLMGSIRYLRQLTAGQAEGHMYADPDRARGGVRNALWDQRMTPGASALTLMALSETIRSLQIEMGESGD